MARSSVQRTIDKKLWATVSSICSRNKDTEAEFIKPIGNDKVNLLLRYVAALLIMKKDCPNSEKDIDKLKTFKLVGNKFIELGGTIKEIQNLYEKNSGKKVITSTEDKKEIPVLNKDNSTDDDLEKGFLTLFGDEEDDTSDFLSGLELDNSDEMDDTVLSMVMDLPYDADIKTLFLQLTKLPEITGFKEENKKNKDDYTYLEYIAPIHSKKSGLKLFRKLKSLNWKYYDNDAVSMYFKHISDIDGYYFSHCDFILGTLPVDFKYGESFNEVKKQYNEEYNNPHVRYNQQILQSFYNKYNKFVESIPLESVKKMVEESSLYEYVMISPDNGMVLTKRYEYTTPLLYKTDDYFDHNQNFKISDSAYNFLTRKLIYCMKREMKAIYEIRFTGDVNYYKELDDTDTQGKIKDNTNRFKKLKKLSAKLKQFIVSNFYVLLSYMDMNAHNLAFDVNHNPMYIQKFKSSKWGNDGYIWWYGKGGLDRSISKNQAKDKATGYYRSLSTKYPCKYKKNMDNAMQYDFVRLFTNTGWKLTGLFINYDETVTITSYKQKNGTEELGCINLTPKGAQLFKNEIKNSDFSEFE